MKQVTVSQLFKDLKALVEAGYGDKKVVISDDNEGNGYHGCFYAVTYKTKAIESLAGDHIHDSEECGLENVVLLG